MRQLFTCRVHHTSNHMSEKLCFKIIDLIENEIGDSERLDHILNTILSERQLYNSDKKYLDLLLFKYFDNDAY